MAADPFSYFDHPRQLTLRSVTPPSTNQINGEQIAGSSTETPIKGHLVDVTTEMAANSGGVLEVGQKTLTTSANVSLGDLVEVTDKRNVVVTWKVEKLLKEQYLFEKMGIIRRSYQLTRFK